MPADVLVIDAGSSGLRCQVVRDWSVLSEARRPLLHSVAADAAPFGHEFDLEDVWSAVVAAAGQALAAAGVGEVVALAIAGQREALVFLDGGGRELYGGPNIDVRALSEGAAIDAAYGPEVYATTGRLPSFLFAPARLAWFRQHRPAVFDRVATVFGLAAWLGFRLTGERATPPSLAAEIGLLDVRSAEYARDLLARLQVPAAVLPQLLEPLQPLGFLTTRAAAEIGLPPATPVFVAGPDSQCAVLGAGATTADAGVVGGWSCPVMLVGDAPRLDGRRRTWTGLHVVPGRWIVESNAMDAGRAWDWWRRMLLGEGPDSLERAEALADAAGAGAGGGLMLAGPRAMDAQRMGMRRGGLLLPVPLPPEPEPGRVLRAVLENVAYAVRANLEQAQEVAGREAGSVIFSGGLSRSDLLCRILASVLGRPLLRGSADATAVGAAALARGALGLGACLPPPTVIEPRADEVAVYRDGYRRWLEEDRRLNEEGR